jgi:hypothetical protein
LQGGPAAECAGSDDGNVRLGFHPGFRCMPS